VPRPLDESFRRPYHLISGPKPHRLRFPHDQTPCASTVSRRSSRRARFLTGSRRDLAVPAWATNRDKALPAERAAHLAYLGAPDWNDAGFRGQKVKVLVLDTGFRGYKDQIGKSLPAKVTVRSARKDGNLEFKDSQHGILVAEVVHAVAPDAELFLANWNTDDPETFLDAVKWAREQGVRIITCSVVMPSWSDGEGNGPVHKRLSELLATALIRRRAVLLLRRQHRPAPLVRHVRHEQGRLPPVVRGCDAQLRVTVVR